MLSPSYVGAAARRAGLYPLASVMLLCIAGQFAFFSTHFFPWICGIRRVFPSSGGRILSAIPELEIRVLRFLAGPDRPFREDMRSSRPKIYFLGPCASIPPPRSLTFLFLGVAGGTIERSC